MVSSHCITISSNHQKYINAVAVLEQYLVLVEKGQCMG